MPARALGAADGTAHCCGRRRAMPSAQDAQKTWRQRSTATCPSDRVEAHGAFAVGVAHRLGHQLGEAQHLLHRAQLGPDRLQVDTCLSTPAQRSNASFSEPRRRRRR